MRIIHSTGFLAAAATFLAAGLAQALTPLGTVFTYQGRLTDNGSPANGNYSMTFTLYDAAAGGSVVGTPIGPILVAVDDGLFAELLDFGASVFNGEARWLEISVNGTPLAPRQELTAAPYATFAALPWKTVGSTISYNAGNVGIGTASPQARLHIAGTPGVDGIRFPDGSMQTTAATGGTGFWSPNGTHIFKNNTGNVGIGTSSPTTALDVRGLLTLDSGTDAAILTGTGAGELNRYLSLYNSLQFTSASGLRAGGVLVADSYAYANPGKNDLIVKGNVGIGTATPGAKLHLLDPSLSVTHVIETGGGTNAWAKAVFKNGNGQWDMGTSRGFNGDVFYVDRIGSSPLEFQLSPTGNLGLGIQPQAKLHLYDSAASVSQRIQTGGGTNSWARVEFANGDGQWDIGTSRNFNGNQLYFYRQGSPTIAFAIQPNGDAFLNGTLSCKVLSITGADVAEKFPTSDGQADPGTVMEIDPENAGRLRVARQAYSTRVAGVVSGAGGLSVGAVLGNLPENEGGPPIALSGRVWVHCDASSGAIEPGDLLTTSNTPGHAMKAADRDRSHGAILGKAMTSLPQGEKGLVLVLVNLQ